MKNQSKQFLRTFLVELILYAVLLVVYFSVIFPSLEEPINRLFYGNPYVYASAALLLVVIQSVLLEFGIGKLTERLNVGRPE